VELILVNGFFSISIIHMFVVMNVLKSSESVCMIVIIAVSAFSQEEKSNVLCKLSSSLCSWDSFISEVVQNLFWMIGYSINGIVSGISCWDTCEIANMVFGYDFVSLVIPISCSKRTFFQTLWSCEIGYLLGLVCIQNIFSSKIEYSRLDLFIPFQRSCLILELSINKNICILSFSKMNGLMTSINSKNREIIIVVIL